MKNINFLRKYGLLVLGMVLLTTCMDLNTDYDPEKAIGPVKITGSLDITDTTSAILSLKNRSKTIDVSKVIITQEEVPETYIEFNGKPKPLTVKAQYVRPSDKEYHIHLEYFDAKKQENATIETVISTPKPGAEYPLYIYRAQDGTVIIAESVDEHNVDTEDTGTPVMVAEDEGVGSIPWVIPSVNRGHMGAFVVVNLTKDQGIDYVEFTTSAPVDSPDYRKYRMVGEPRIKDQQGIALTQGAWLVHLAYTPKNGKQKETDNKNAIVMPLRESVQSLYNYMYFYKTKTGTYEVSMWPPTEDDLSGSDNAKPESFLTEDQGLLEITNKSETGKIIYDIMIDGMEYKNVMLAKDDVHSFLLAAGSANVSFRPQGQTLYGLSLPRTILPKKINTFSYYDSLSSIDPDEVPFDFDGYGTANIKITNKTNAVVQNVYIVDPNDPMGIKLSKTARDFTPALPINYDQTGWVKIYGTHDFPLGDQAIYLIQVEMFGGSGKYYTEYYRVLKGQLVMINIDETDLPVTKSYGSLVTIENKVDTESKPGADGKYRGGPLSITGMQVWNVGAPHQRSYYGASMWTGGENIINGKNASLYVVSSPEMPVVNGNTYKADIFVSGNGRTAIIEKEFVVDGKLYGEVPDTHTRTITVSTADLPEELFGSFIPVTNITGMPSTITSTVYSGTETLVGAGWFNLNGAVAIPENATNREISWVASGSNQDYYTLSNGMLTVKKGKKKGETVTIQVTATITKGKGTLNAQTDYSQSFSIKLEYDEFAPESNLATKLNPLSMNIYVGQEVSLMGQVLIEPTGATKEGVPITASYLTFEVTSGTAATVTGNVIKGISAGDVTVKATLPAQYCAGNTALTATINVKVNAVFIDVTGITFTPPTTVESSVEIGTKNLVVAGWSNLNTALVIPTNATNQKITWTASGDGATYLDTAKLSEGILLVSSAPTIATASTTVTKTVTLKATITNGKSAGTADYEKTFSNVVLKFVAAPDTTPPSKLATALTSKPLTMYVKDSKSLLEQVTIEAADANLEGVPIKVLDLTFAISEGTAATVSGSTITSKDVAGNVKVKATLPAKYSNTGAALTTEFTVTINPVGIDIVYVTGIAYTPAVVESTVMPGTNTLVNPGWQNLNAAKIAPAAATYQQIKWAASGNDKAYIDEAKLAEGLVIVKAAPSVAEGATVEKTITLTATIVGGKSAGVDFTAVFDIKLRFTCWSYNLKVTGLTLSSTAVSVYEQDTKNLVGYININPAGAYRNGVPITTNDLDWEVGYEYEDFSDKLSTTVKGDKHLTINKGNITGVSKGKVQVRAKLPGTKNGGGSDLYSPWIIVTINAMPKIGGNDGNGKASFWFLFMALNDGIVFVPCSDNSWSDTIRQTGKTNKTWASSDNDFNKTTFLQKHPDAIIGGRMAAMGYTPGTVFEGDPRPMVYPDSGMYYVFFLKQETGKSDMRVYGDGPATSAGNKLFLLDLNSRGPSITLKNVSGAVSNTAMYTDRISWDASLNGVIQESSCTLQQKANNYYNNMGIPIGIYRFRYWNNEITFQEGVYSN